MPAGQEEEGAAVPPAQRSSWSSFLKAIASFSGDLSSLTAPPFILSPVSLTEFPAYWLERPGLFAAIADGVDEQDRNLRVVQWFISTLKGQYTSRNDSMGSEKKPLNPVLGELFFGYWPDKDGRGTTKLTVEQVSHHPPITAYYITNKDKGLILQGHSAQKTSFSTGAIIVKQIGHAILTINLPNGNQEKYLITLPKLRIDGLWYGSPYIELTEMSYIQSSSGWSTAIEYKGRGYFSGKSHTFKAVMSPPPSPSAGLSVTPNTAIVAEGQWTTTSKITSYTPSRSGRSSPVSPSINGDTFTDVTSPKEEVTVAAVEQQDDWETRKLWLKVAKGIREGDYEAASREKTRIENWQRQMRKDEQAAGSPWQLKYFVHVDSDPDYERLVLGLKGTTVPPSEDAYLYNEPKA